MSGGEPGFIEHLANNRYFDRHFEVEAVKVLPGEYYVTTSDMVLVTVLGSCVSACIRDREKGIGGMNHFMLAESADSAGLSASARYGTYAMEILINHLLKLGARRNNLEAKVFGGGRVMASLSSVIKRDLSSMGKWLTVGAVVLMAAAIINVFVASSAGMMAISVLAIGIFSAFILYDLKRIMDGGEPNYISATLGLYLSIYNVFQSLLILLGMGGGSSD